MFDTTDPALTFAQVIFVGIAALCVIVARRSIFPGRRYLFLATFATLWWLFVTAMELSSTGLEAKVFWSKLSWVGSTLCSISWTFFLFDYCFGRSPDRHWPRYAVILCTLALILAGSQTNQFHGLFYGPGTVLITDAAKPYVIYDHGPLLFACAALLYLWFVSSVGVVVYAAVRAGRIYRPIFRILLAVALIPVTGNLGYLLFDVTFFDFDPTPFLFAFSLILVSWLLFVSRILELDSIAKEAIFVSTPDPILTYDRQGRMAGANAAAKRLLGTSVPAMGQRIPIDGPIWSFAQQHLDDQTPPPPGQIQVAGRHYDIRQQPIERPLHRGDPIMGWVLSLRDTTDLLKLTAELRAESHRLGTLMEHNASGVFVVGPDNIVSYANAQMAQILALEVERLEGMNINDPRFALQVEDHGANGDQRLPVRRVRDLGVAVSGSKVSVARPDGSRRVLTVTAAPLDAGGRVVCSVFDITEEVHAAEAMREAAQRAEAASEAKSQFLANMSHEIRTPLNGVLGMAEVLSYTDLTPEQARVLGTIQQSGELLLGILNDVLDMAKIESGQLTLAPAPMRPLDLGPKIEALFGDQAAAKGLTLQVEMRGDAQARRMGDEMRLLQILQNLTSNAIKFTERGEVLVRISAPEGGPLTLQVRDSGIGMTPEEMERVFEAFQQADPSITRRFGGTGLGLAILRSLVDLMGGTLDVHSEKGLGSDFSVILPLPELSPEPAGYAR